MPSPRVLILRAPGTNCDRETAYAFERAGAVTEPCHINRLLESPQRLLDFQIACLPGGFSYGDDVAAGRILANQFRHHLTDFLREFRDAGKLIFGICNGFQILIKSGILLEDEPAGPPATLTWNESGRYTDRWVHVQATGDRCVFLRGIERMFLPIAHAEGKFVTRDLEALARLRAAGQLALRYTTEAGTSSMDEPLPFPANPNGSMRPDRPSVRTDAPPRTPHRSHSSSPLDAIGASRSWRWFQGVSERRSLLRMMYDGLPVRRSGPCITSSLWGRFATCPPVPLPAGQVENLPHEALSVVRRTSSPSIRPVQNERSRRPESLNESVVGQVCNLPSGSQASRAG